MTHLRLDHRHDVGVAAADERLDRLLARHGPAGGRDRRDVDVDDEPLAVDQHPVAVEDDQGPRSG